ncbi:Immunoglobulin-like domain [Trinorchestia longiramus]|nr:Immunoglobulin-like domain [Trinorchestia longiramus]
MDTVGQYNRQQDRNLEFDIEAIHHYINYTAFTTGLGRHHHQHHHHTITTTRSSPYGGRIDKEKPTNSYPISTGEKIVLFSSKYSILHPQETFQYSLQILDIAEEDTGTYRCTVNFGDNQKINAEVPVLIQKAPYFVDPNTKTLTVTEGDAISIDCQPGGSPTPTVFWERIESELPFYGGNFFK